MSALKILITSGGCKSKIDDVRHIGNFSSGRIGSQLADFFVNEGHDVVFFMEKGSIMPEEDCEIHQYNDYVEYLKVKELIESIQPDMIISAAAISDYVVANPVKGKVSSLADTWELQLKKSEKVINSFRSLAPNALIVGFKLLVDVTDENVINEAVHSQLQHTDLVVYNDLHDLRQGHLKRVVYKKATNPLATMSKYTCFDTNEIAKVLLEEAKANISDLKTKYLVIPPAAYPSIVTKKQLKSLTMSADRYQIFPLGEELHLSSKIALGIKYL